MRVVDAIAEIMKREGVEVLVAYPVNPLIEACAAADIRTIIVRQERTGIHMVDAISRLTSGKKVGVFCCQNGPGAENAFGGIAQAYSESVPMVFIPAGYGRQINQVFPNFNSALNYCHVTKWSEQLTTAAALPEAMRRAFTQARNGRPGPTMLEVPGDLWREEVEIGDYQPTTRVRFAPDSSDVARVAQALVDAQRPVIYAGQGVHYAEAWDELKELAELLEAPVTTSLEGKSAFPENHPLSLGSGGRAMPEQVWRFITDADLIFAVGASMSRTGFGIQLPRNKPYIHNTIDPVDINKDIPTQFPLIGDSKLTLQALIPELRQRLAGRPRGKTAEVNAEITKVKAGWMEKWTPKLFSDETPLSPYRVVWDLLRTVDVPNTVITHDAGSPRDQLSPFWESVTPLSYVGWGKTTQLGYGLGLAMGAKLAHPDKTCINVWGDAAIGMTGMDFETAARERIPILSILMNNFSMAIELPVMPISTEKYRSTDISGNYADFATALGGYGERVTTPDQIIPAIKRGLQANAEGKPALLEFITQKETEISAYGRG
jgi:thiamine pyrophosphate-dependent acetolactate synthase large subunit-like protein